MSGEREGKPQLRLVFGAGPVPESSATFAGEPVAEHRSLRTIPALRSTLARHRERPAQARERSPRESFYYAEPEQARPVQD